MSSYYGIQGTTELRVQPQKNNKKLEKKYRELYVISVSNTLAKQNCK